MSEHVPAAQCEFVHDAARGDYACIHCGFRWPRPIGRNCRQPGTSAPPSPRRTRRVLTTAGKILICLPPPGDAVAAITKYTGLTHLAELWEKIARLPCGCGDRQAWLNRRWQEFIYQHCSRLVEV